jgi:FMN-dependent NADH-azoreductase
VKLLEIQSSPRGKSSDSITLTKSFIEACKSDNISIVVDTLNVWHERLPEFDYETIGAKYKAVNHETMTEAESNVWKRVGQDRQAGRPRRVGNDSSDGERVLQTKHE